MTLLETAMTFRALCAAGFPQKQAMRLAARAIRRPDYAKKVAERRAWLAGLKYEAWMRALPYGAPLLDACETVDSLLTYLARIEVVLQVPMPEAEVA